jgi:hypothetical protein
MHVLYDPDEVWTDRNEPWLHIYLCATGPDSYYMVLVHRRISGEPRYRFVTAYPLDRASVLKKKKNWKRIYPSPPKGQKNKKGAPKGP